MELNKQQVSVITHRAIIKFSFVCLITLLVSWLVFHLSYQHDLTKIRQSQEQSIIYANTAFSKELGNIRKLVKLLVSNQALRRTEPMDDDWQVEQLKQYFIDFGQAAGNISQIRWLDTEGQEQYRVNFTKGNYEVVARNELQNKLSRYYFQQGILVSPPDIYTSALDLNIEHQVIVDPYQPTIRVTYRTLAEDHLVNGLLAVNFDLSELFTQLRASIEPLTQLQVLNSNGYWLLNKQRDKEWGFMLSLHDQTLAVESPALWAKINNSAAEKIVSFSEDALISFFKLATFTSNSSLTQDNHIIILAGSAVHVFDSAFNQALMYGFICSFILLLFSGAYLYRDYRFQLKLLNASILLKGEQLELTAANKQLKKYVTQQQQFQDDLVEAQKLSSLGMMVAGIAHEMNTPVGGAVIATSNTQAISKKLQEQIDSGVTKTFLTQSLISMDDNLQLTRINLDKAVQHIKSFKRMAIDRASDQLVSCDINKIVDDLFFSLSPRFKATRIDVQKHLDVTLLLMSRPGIISQIIENLILNAIEHAFAEGESGVIQVRAVNLGKDIVCITVADNGKGIDSSLIDNLFDPFVTTGRKDGHTGLGLYMVHQWVTKILQGRMHLVQNKHLPDEMTTQFEILLPIDISTI